MSDIRVRIEVKKTLAKLCPLLITLPDYRAHFLSCFLFYRAFKKYVEFLDPTNPSQKYNFCCMQWWKTDVLCPFSKFSYLDTSLNWSVSWISNLHLILNLNWYESFCPYCSVLREFESPLSFFTFQITQPTSFHLVPSGPSMFFDKILYFGMQ